MIRISKVLLVSSNGNRADSQTNAAATYKPPQTRSSSGALNFEQSNATHLNTAGTATWFLSEGWTTHRHGAPFDPDSSLATKWTTNRVLSLSWLREYIVIMLNNFSKTMQDNGALIKRGCNIMVRPSELLVMYSQPQVLSGSMSTLLSPELSVKQRILLALSPYFLSIY